MSEEGDLSNLRFGEYQAISILGRGATSTVYLAEKKFGRFDAQPEGADPAELNGEFPSLDLAEDAPSKPSRAAVKVVSFTDETTKLSRRFRKLFATEAWVASQLDHPNITKVFGWQVEEERAYLILEHLEGQTLDAFITMDKLLPVQQVVDLMHKIAVALDYAHRKGVVNRDVKPANVMLCANGEVKLMDFGLALNIKKNVDIDSTYINGLGSPSYMSPEQIKGYTLNHQTDLYSMGVMFYQLLTGRLPFRAKNTASLVYKIINTDAVPVNQLNPELPEFTHTVIARAMEKDLYSRYRQGAQMAKDLSDAPYQRIKKNASVNLDQRWKAVRALPVLGGLDDMDIWELLRASSWREYAPAKMLFQAGDADKSFGLVIDGHVEIEIGAKSLSIASKGDFVGIIEWLDSAADVRRATTATTLDKVVYLEINPAAFAYATEELSEEIRRLAIDEVVKRMRGGMRLAKQLSPPAVHPAPEVADEALAAAAATVEKPLGWGAFAGVDAKVAAVAAGAAVASGAALAANTAPPSRAAASTASAAPAVNLAAAGQVAASVSASAPSDAAAAAPPDAASPAASRAAPSAPSSTPQAAPVSEPPEPAVPLLPITTEAPYVATPEPTRRSTVVVQPLPAAAAAAIAQYALGYSGAPAMSSAAPAAFELGPPSVSGGFPSLMPADDNTVPVSGDVKPVSELPSGTVLTTEMAPNYSATTAFSPSDMEGNFMSTTSLDSASEAMADDPPGLVMPDFDVNSSGTSTSEMAPNFAGTTAFSAGEFTVPNVIEPDDSDAGGMLTTDLAPDFAGTTAFSYSDVPPPLPERPAARMSKTAAKAAPKAAPAATPVDDFDDMKTTEMAPDFAATTAFSLHDVPPPMPPRPAVSAAVAATVLEFDPEKTVMLSGGFGSSKEESAKFTEELFPALEAVAPSPFGVAAPARRAKDIPPEDFDKTVEISGGFESQPAEEEAPLDDLFPPIKF